jgi:hypothetical protein
MDDGPLLVRHLEAQRLLGIGASHYFKLIREGRIQSVGRGKMSRAVYSSIRKRVGVGGRSRSREGGVSAPSERQRAALDWCEERPSN